MRHLLIALALVTGLFGRMTAVGLAAAEDKIPEGAERAKVVSVVDGDTIKVERANSQTKTVRLLLIDTPETRDPNDPVECYGAEATKRTKVMLPKGRTVYLEKDVSDTDRYKRL
ncbi:MAG: thermonuclease family protein, partial [Chloroflexota bacterium]|nr:thermonuclease family protein [Chloroflexota bacterium]